MKAKKRKAVETALLAAGALGVSREHFEADRNAYGTAFIRRLQELEEFYFLDKESSGGFITRWTIRGKKTLRPQAADVPRELYIGAVAGIEFYEVLQ